MSNISERVMTQAANVALKTARAGKGGPFGAAVYDPKKKKIISIASNSVLEDADPTAHAEVNAIRLACIKLGTHDLSGMVLYTTAYPCPMCIGATMWANIKEVYYGCTPKDAADIGFRDDFMYTYIQDGMEDVDTLRLTPAHREVGLRLFKDYKEIEGELY